MEQFTIVKRGYDPEEVNKYIATLEGVVKSYKDKDNAIKNAIISAQVASDNMIKNAKLQADEYKKQIVVELDNVRKEVEKQRTHINTFHDVYSTLINKYLKNVNEHDFNAIGDKLNDVDNLIKHLQESDIVPAPADDAANTI